MEFGFFRDTKQIEFSYGSLKVEKKWAPEFFKPNSLQLFP